MCQPLYLMATGSTEFLIEFESIATCLCRMGKTAHAFQLTILTTSPILVAYWCLSRYTLLVVLRRSPRRQTH